MNWVISCSGHGLRLLHWTTSHPTGCVLQSSIGPSTDMEINLFFFPAFSFFPPLPEFCACEWSGQLTGALPIPETQWTAMHLPLLGGSKKTRSFKSSQRATTSLPGAVPSWNFLLRKKNWKNQRPHEVRQPCLWGFAILSSLSLKAT